ncbi:MAG: DNA primase [bacterium]
MAENIVKSTGFDRSQIEEIKARIPIEDVISRYVRLKPSGKNMFGLCPFHKEDTPSFSVNPELQIFKCFGCGEGGDVLSFIQKIENIEFNDALEKLAQEAGIELKFTKRDPQETQKYTHAKESHKLSNFFFKKILQEHKLGEKGRDYIKQRGFTKLAVDNFQIGYAPKSPTNNLLTNQLIKKGYKKEDLVNYGISVERRGQIMDKFVDRIMFPIIDNSGNTIAFSGRITSKEDERPKYLNSPETVLFQKRRNLFGFYQAKQDVRIKKFTILVEGQTDVLSSWQMGIKNIVAPLGTGVTEDQIEKIKKLSPNLILAFDADNAGLRAIMKTAIIALQKNMNVYAAQILYGKDADECIKKDSNLWKKTVDERIPVVSFFLNIITQKYSPHTLAGKKIIIEKIGPIMMSIKDKVTKDHHIKEISTLTGINSDILRETFSSDTLKSPESTISYLEKIDDDFSKEGYLLTLITQYHEDLVNQIRDFDSQLINNIEIKEIIQKIQKQIDGKKELKISSISKKINTSSEDVLRDSAMRPLWIEKPPRSEIIDEFKETVRLLSLDQIHHEISVLRNKLEIAEKQGKTKDSNELLNKVNQKIAEIDKLSHS